MSTLAFAARIASAVFLVGIVVFGLGAAWINNWRRP